MKESRGKRREEERESEGGEGSLVGEEEREHEGGGEEWMGLEGIWGRMKRKGRLRWS